MDTLELVALGMAGSGVLGLRIAMSMYSRIRINEIFTPNPRAPFHKMPVQSIDDLLDTESDGSLVLVEGMPQEYTSATIPEAVLLLSRYYDFMLASGGKVIHCAVPQNPKAGYILQEAIKTRRLLQVGGGFYYLDSLPSQVKPLILVQFLSSEVARERLWYNVDGNRYYLPQGVKIGAEAPVPA